MAVLNLTLNVPDNKVQELTDALNWKWNTNLTPAQIRDQIEDNLKDHLVKAYTSHKKYLASIAPIDDDFDIT